VEVIRTTAGKPTEAHIFNFASQVWNIEFFLRSLTPGTRNISEDLLERLERHFGSFSHFQQQFTDTALAIFGGGYVWLCEHPITHQLFIRATYNTASPLTRSYPLLYLNDKEKDDVVKSNDDRRDIATPTTPTIATSLWKKAVNEDKPRVLLGLSVWEHTYWRDYGMEKEEYVRRFWDKVNWEEISLRSGSRVV